jgi:hypothetical protein
MRSSLATLTSREVKPSGYVEGWLQLKMAAAVFGVGFDAKKRTKSSSGRGNRLPTIISRLNLFNQVKK